MGQPADERWLQRPDRLAAANLVFGVYDLSGTPSHRGARPAAEHWQAYGNEAELAVYPDCIHGFTFFPIELASRAHERIAEFLDVAFA